MSIYTSNNIKVLGSKPLDAKTAMTTAEINAAYDAGQLYPGQIVYNTTTKTFMHYIDISEDAWYGGENTRKIQPIFEICNNGDLQNNITISTPPGYVGNDSISIGYLSNYASIEVGNSNSWIIITANGITGEDAHNQVFDLANTGFVYSKPIQFGTGLTGNAPYIFGQYDSTVDGEGEIFVIGDGTSGSSSNRHNMFSISHYPGDEYDYMAFSNGIIHAKDVQVDGSSSSLASVISHEPYTKMVLGYYYTDGAGNITASDVLGEYGLWDDPEAYKTVPNHQVFGTITNIYITQIGLPSDTKLTVRHGTAPILTDYPVGQIPEGEVGIENKISHISNGTINATITSNETIDFTGATIFITFEGYDNNTFF